MTINLEFGKYDKTFGLGGKASDLGPDVLNGAVKAIAMELGVAIESVEYLLQYGYRQSMQDCIAGRAKSVEDELVAKAKKDGQPKPTDAAIDAAVIEDGLARLAKRHDAIIGGTIGTSERDGLKTVASDMVRNALAEQKMKVKKEKFDQLVDDLLTVPAKRKLVQAEADRRKAVVAVKLAL